MKKHIILLAIFGSIVWASCGDETKSEDAVAQEVARQSKSYDLALEEKLSMFEALPVAANSATNPMSASKVALGHKLYFDTQLSKDGNISCNSCHNLATFGVDNLSTSPGDAGENGDRNSPTVLNAALHISQFWDGRAKDVEEQAGMPILNPVEMAIPNEQFLINRLKNTAEYPRLFDESFPESDNPVSYENLRLAIAAFERKLLTPTRFDQYLQGDKEALTVQEKKGMLSFAAVGCMTCHQGPALGGTLIQKFGVYGEYWSATGSKQIDEGLAATTQKEIDKYYFKVPSLRNIEKTGPYFHDGSVADLAEAVNIMADLQLDYKLSESELENLVAFLKALTGEVPEVYQKAPM